MFGARYFGRRYFAPRYFGHAGASAVLSAVRGAIATIRARAGAGLFRARAGAATFMGLEP